MPPTDDITYREPIPKIRWLAVGNSEVVQVDCLLAEVAYFLEGENALQFRGIGLSEVVNVLRLWILWVKFQTEKHFGKSVGLCQGGCRTPSCSLE
jgi:hypothetical protein